MTAWVVAAAVLAVIVGGLSWLAYALDEADRIGERDQ